MEKLLIATHNRGKIHEFKQILEPKGINVLSAADFNLPEPVEDGQSFEDNALIKAKAAAIATGLPALSDDSGLCVNALDGAPGIYSARWAGPDKNFPAAMKRIHDEIGNNSDHSAYFIAVLALAYPDGSHKFFEGRCDGLIVWPPRGLGGHGYDPVFQPKGQTRTFAEMNDSEKNALSHRGKAVSQFLKSLDL